MGISRVVKKVMNKTRKAVKKRYTTKKGGVRVNRMAKDIMYLKSVLNPEKKRFERTLDFIDGLYPKVGQVNGNNDGGYFEDVTPTPLQGITYSTRNGASIKLHSSVWHFQFSQEVGVVADVKLCLEIFAIEKNPYTGFTFRDERYLPNPFIASTIRDYNSQLNPDNYMKGKLVARRYIKIKADDNSGVKNLIDIKIPVLYNKGKGMHIRFNKDSQTVEHGQLYLVLRADRGNIGIVSTLAIPDVNINTGINFQYNRVDYFYDN